MVSREITKEVTKEGGSGAQLPPIQANGASVVVPDAHLLFTAEFSRIGDDLLLTGQDGTVLLIKDYFALDAPPMLLSPLGAMLSADLVAVLVGPRAPGQYAQAGAPEGAEPIGQVESLSGTAQVTRADGVTVQLNVGDPVFQGDVVQTGAGSTLGITFVDGTVFSLSAGARMVLHSMVYDPDGTSNSMLFNLIQGTFVFVTGQVAPTGSMRVETPVATIGIRGTTPIVKISAVDGVTTFSIAPDPDGFIGSYELFHKLTGVQIATVTDTAKSLRITDPSAPVQELDKTPVEAAEDGAITLGAYATFNRAQERLQEEKQEEEEEGRLEEGELEQAAAEAAESAGEPIEVAAGPTGLQRSGSAYESTNLGSVIEELSGFEDEPPAGVDGTMDGGDGTTDGDLIDGTIIEPVPPRPLRNRNLRLRPRQTVRRR